MIAALIKGIVLGFPNAAVPGPFQAYILAHVMKHGSRRSFPIAFAPLVTDGPIIALNLLILAQLSKHTLGYVQIVGGLFILYLAFGAYRAMRSTESKNKTQDENARMKGFFKGVLMNALNPNPYIFWGTVGGPILLGGWQSSPFVAAAFLIGFYGTLIAGFSILIGVFGKVSHLHPKARKILSGISAAALVLFGFLQLFLGIKTVLAA